MLCGRLPRVLAFPNNTVRNASTYPVGPVVVQSGFAGGIDIAFVDWIFVFRDFFHLIAGMNEFRFPQGDFPIMVQGHF